MKFNKKLLFSLAGITTSLSISLVACGKMDANKPKEAKPYQATEADSKVKTRAANNLGTLAGPYRLIVRGTYALNDGLFAKRYTKLAGEDATKKQAVETFKTTWMQAVKETVSLFKNDPKGAEYFVSKGEATSEEYLAKKQAFLAKAKAIMETVVIAAKALGIQGTYSSDYMANLADLNPLVNLIKNSKGADLYSGENWVPNGNSVNDLARFLESQTMEVDNPEFPNDATKKLPSGNFSKYLAQIQDDKEFTKVALIAISVLTQRMVTLFDGAIYAAKITEGKVSLQDQQTWFNNVAIKSNMLPRAEKTKAVLTSYQPYVNKMVEQLKALFANDGKASLLINELKADSTNNEHKAKLLTQLTSLSKVLNDTPQSLDKAFNTLISFFKTNDQWVDLNDLTKDLDSYKAWYAKIGYSWNFALQVLFRLNDYENGVKDLDTLITNAALTENENAKAVLNAVSEIKALTPGDNRFIFNQKVRWLTSLQQEILASNK